MGGGSSVREALFSRGGVSEVCGVGEPGFGHWCYYRCAAGNPIPTGHTHTATAAAQPATGERAGGGGREKPDRV